ncbi:hypothetical protein IAU59_003767 [Kwoniella sp. CBS 9459]
MPAYDHDDDLRLSLPIEPSSPSLHSHLAALDTLSLRLSILTSSTCHPVRIPLTSKASIKGKAIHTNDIKVHLGGAVRADDGDTSGKGAGEIHGGWWVDMTASEAAEYIRRRKRNLLEHHARLSEGAGHSPGSSRYMDSTGTAGAEVEKGNGEPVISSAPSIGLHPIFFSTSSAQKTGPSSQGRNVRTPRTDTDTEPREEKTDQPKISNSPSDTLSTSQAVSEPSAKVHGESESEKSPQNETGQVRVTDVSVSTIKLPTSTRTPPSPAISATSVEKSKKTNQSSSRASQVQTAKLALDSPGVSTKGASLVEILDDEDEDEQNSQHAGPGDDTTLNEEGLPFHEIRETLDGETIGPAPPASTSADEPIMAAQEEEEEKDDYNTPEAIARRAALRRKLFGEGEGSDSEDEGEGASAASTAHTDKQDATIHAIGGIIRASSKAQKPSSPPPPTMSASPAGTASPTEPSFSSPSQSALANRRSSSSMPPPNKSILKPPTRKKSVSFDPSIPSPPESPDKGSSAQGKFGFDLPWAKSANAWEEEEDFGQPKPVPVISTPQPTKKNVEEKGFAGFKKGFLSGPPKVRTNQDDKPPTPALPTTMNAKPSSPAPDAVKSTVKEVAPPSTVAKPSKVSAASLTAATIASKDPLSTAPKSAPTPRKPSLFAQRLSKPEIDASAPHINTTTPTRTPALPKASETKSTNTVKSSVVEKPPSAPRVDVRPIVERPPAVRQVITSANKSSELGDRATLSGHRSGDRGKSVGTSEDNEGDYIGAEDDDDDDELEDYSSGEEDEYDLDEALLAREVALEYHRRQAYQPLNRDPDDVPMGVEGDQGEAEGGVMLGLPRISDLDPQGQGPLIVNPTPDDLRRFVRVGRLENGNLVLAPGEEGFPADSESDDEDQPGQAQSQGEGLVPSHGPTEVSRTDSKSRGLSSEKEEERARRKRNRDAIKRQLMGLEVPDELATTAGRRAKTAAERAEAEWKSSLPPSLAPASSSTPTPTQGKITEVVDEENKRVTNLGPAPAPVASAVRESRRSPVPSAVGASANRNTSVAASSLTTTTERPKQSQEEAPTKPKKVSKFKAARMAGN